MSNNPNEFELDPETVGYIGDLNSEMQRAMQPYAQAMNAALGLVCRQNKLPGQWKLSEDGQKLIRVDVQPQAEFTKKSPRKR